MALHDFQSEVRAFGVIAGKEFLEAARNRWLFPERFFLPFWRLP